MNKKQHSQRKLLILIWNMGIGGIQKRVRDVILYLARHHPQVKVFLLVKKKEKSHLIDQIASETDTQIKYFSHSHSKFYIFLSFFWIIKHYLLIRPQVSLTFLEHLSIKMILTKKLTFWHKSKLVLNEGIYTSKYLSLHRHPVWHILVRFFYRHADTIITPTINCKQDLSSNYQVPKHKIVVIPNWTTFSPSQKHSKKIYDFIYIGRLEKEKNIFVLLSTIEKLRTSKTAPSLCVLGTGRLKKQLLKATTMKNIKSNVNFFGFQPDVRPFLNKSKVLLLPSINEGLPNCVLEAGIYSLPSIVNNFVGADQVVIHGHTGLIANNDQEFIHYSNKLLQNQAFRDELGKNAQKRVLKKFHQQNLHKFVKELLSK